MKLSNNWHCEKNRTDDSGTLSLKNDESCTRAIYWSILLLIKKDSRGLKNDF